MKSIVINNKNKENLFFKLNLINNIEKSLKELREYAKKDNHENAREITEKTDNIIELIRDYYPQDTYEADVMLQKLMFLVNDLYYQEKGLIDYIKWNKEEKEKSEQNKVSNIEEKLYINMMKVVDIIVK